MVITASGSERGNSNDYRIVHRVSSVRKPIMARKPDPRTGLGQILEMKDVAMDPASPSSSSSSQLQSQDELMQSGQMSWCFPQLGAAVPTFNDVSVRFAETASLFSRHFSGLAEEPMLSEAHINEAEASGSSEVEMTPLIVRDTRSSEESSSSPVEQQQIVVTVPPFRDSAAQSESPLALANFGGAVQLFNATGAAMMGMGQTLLTGPPAVWQGLVSRVQTTLRGSADDIGWLQKDTSLPPVVDKTERFLEILGRISHGVHILPDSIVYLLIPGLFSNHGPMYFVDTKKYLSKLGLPCYIAKIHSEAAVEKNARELKDYIEELYWGTGKRVMLLGHSKGGVDAAAACAKYWPNLKDKVVGLVFSQSPYGGSPVASDILREGQIADFETKKILELIITKVLKGDMQALEDLTYEKRREFVSKYPLPTDLLTLSFHTEASRAASVLSTMSHIAHAELPWLPGTSSNGTGTSEEAAAGAKLPVVIPLAAAMALCALHLDLRYGEKSDGLVARKDAEVPGSVVIRPEKKLDHAWMVYTPSRKESNDPSAAQMWEALLTLLLEEESARKAASSSDDKAILDETSQPSSSTPEVASTDIAEGESVLEKL
ncbi:unnamed protein product [Calypogeia fissa]